MKLHEIKKFLHSKRNGHQIEEAAIEWIKIFASYTSDKGLKSRIYQELRKLSSQNINVPMAN
jgi:hypothetical protein